MGNRDFQFNHVSCGGYDEIEVTFHSAVNLPLTSGGDTPTPYCTL